MFELQSLQGAGDVGIALQTRTGRDICNLRGLDLTERHLQRHDALLAQHGQNWKPRRPPSGEYNCAGHVWASRRTCIYDENDWRMILSEDGYQQTSDPVADDLVLYIEKDHGILHIGRVVELRKGLVEESPRVPWVVSKWSDCSGEVCHFAHDHPFQAFGFVVTNEYWTDRPATERQSK